jgi:hypothetical protein
LRADLDVSLQKFQDGLNTSLAMAKQKGAEIEKVFQDLNPKINSNLFIGSIAGIGSALGLDKALDLLVSMNKQMAELDEAAKRAGQDTEAFQKNRFALNLGGASDAAVATDLKDMNKLLEDAAHKTNDLTKLLDVNNIKYKDQNGLLITSNQLLTIAAGLIHNAAKENDKFTIGSKLGLSPEVTKALDVAPEQFRSLAESARDAGVIIDQATIERAQKFTTEWNAASVRWSASMRAAAAEILPYLDRLIERALALGPAIGKDLAARSGAEKLTTGDALNLKELDATIDRLKGLIENYDQLSQKGNEFNKMLDSLNTTFGTGFFDKFKDDSKQSVASVDELRAALDRLLKQRAAFTAQNLPTDLLPPAGSGSSKTTVLPGDDKSGASRDFFDRAVDSLNKHASALLADAAAVGLNASEHEKLRAELALLSAAEQVNDDLTTQQVDTYAKLRQTMSAQQALAAANIKLTDEQAAAFGRVPERIFAASNAARSAQNSFAGATDALKFSGNQLVDVLGQIGDKTVSLSDIGRSALRAFTQELLRAVVTGEGAFAKLLGLASSVPGGVGGIFGLLRTSFSLGVPAAAAAAGGVGVPTISIPAAVVPAQVSGRGQSDGGSSLTQYISIDARGADQAAVVRIDGAVKELQRATVKSSPGAVRIRQVRKTRP